MICSPRGTLRHTNGSAELEWLSAPTTEPMGTFNGGSADGLGGLRPAPRRGHSCALLAPQRQLLLSGGTGADGVSFGSDDGLWSFDLDVLTWRQIRAAAMPGGALPPPPLVPLAACGSRAIRMSCEADVRGYGDGSSGGDSSGGARAAAASDPAPASDAVLAFSGSRSSWEWLQLRSTSSSKSGARMGLPSCPGARLGARCWHSDV